MRRTKGTLLPLADVSYSDRPESRDSAPLLDPRVLVRTARTVSNSCGTIRTTPVSKSVLAFADGSSSDSTASIGTGGSQRPTRASETPLGESPEYSRAYSLSSHGQ